MRLLFRQRMFSWFDSYDIYDEAAGYAAWNPGTVQGRRHAYPAKGQVKGAAQIHGVAGQAPDALRF